MNKKQQMRWNRTTVQPFLDVRAAVLHDTLEDAFRRRYPGFRPTNDDEAITAATQVTPQVCMISIMVGVHSRTLVYNERSKC
jgi:methylmalonyl-CoA mutase cobalamin-binding subunit